MFNAGDQIGAYVVQRRLGVGGMGEVYLAQHRHIDRMAAIKVLLPDLSTKEDIVARFFTEARAASRIKHPGIVEIVDCDLESGRAYIVMEYLEGESLGDCLGRVWAFDVKSALGVTGQIASALAAAHAKGIVHRDLKPDNVFLASTPTAEAPIAVKVLDFGIAKLLADGSGTGRKTQTGSLLGTPLYMSPEQCRGADTLDHRTDIYSLGCILFEMIAGRAPFVRESPGEMIAAHLTEPPPDLHETEASIPEDLSGLVTRMLAKSPADRPQSMLDVVGEVERLAGAPAARFLTLIDAPQGFPPPAGDGEKAPPRVKTAKDVTQRPARAAPLAGGTKLLPQNPTTFSQTAAEIGVAANPSPRKRFSTWFLAVPAVAAAIGVAVFVARRPVAPGGEGAALPSPASERLARPAEVVPPQPSRVAPPEASPDPPAADRPTTSATKPTGDESSDKPVKISPDKANADRSSKRKSARHKKRESPFTFIPE
jgi:serine/threonine protein kinase